MKKHEIRKLGGPGSGHHGHKGIPGRRGGSAPSGGGGVVGFTRDTIHKYEMMRDASYVSPETADWIMEKAMTDTEGLSAARRAKIVKDHRALEKIYKKYPGFGVGMQREHAIVVPKSGHFAGRPFEVRGYGTFQGGVQSWRVSPLDSKGKPMDLDIIIPKGELD